MHYLPIVTLFGVSLASPLIASVGSSYAFGAGLDTPHSIGGQLQQSLTSSTRQQWSFSNIALSGSVLKDIVNKQAPKLKGKSPDIIYMLSGGNDINYVSCLGNPNAGSCPQPESQADWQTDFEKALDSIFASVSNPHSTTLYVVTYPIAIGPSTKCSSSNRQCNIASSKQVTQIGELYNDQVNWTVDGLKVWQSKTSNKNFNTKLIPMKQHSQSHEVGSTSPWVNGANVKDGAWHPNADGAKNIANFILAEYKKK